MDFVGFFTSGIFRGRKYKSGVYADYNFVLDMYVSNRFDFVWGVRKDGTKKLLVRR